METYNPALLTALTRLDEQLLGFTEDCAFFCEACGRIVSDHPDLAPEVIQGLERQAVLLRRQALAQWQALEAIRKTNPSKASVTTAKDQGQ